MASNANTVKVTFLGDASHLSKVAKQVEKSTGGIGDKFAKMGKAAAVGLGGAVVGLGLFAKKGVDAFARVEDALGGAGVIFGESAQMIESFANAAARNFGMSKGAALDASNTFGTLGKAAGLSGQDLALFSTKFTGLAGDMASFKGTSPEQAIQAIGAALRGETEPIRAYGVMLDDAALRQEALAQGLIKTTKDALTPQQKSLAAQALILKQTSDAQGDFARTSDSTANTAKRLAAETENASAKLGKQLAPAVTMAREAFLKLIQKLTELIDKYGPATQAAFEKIRQAVQQMIDKYGPAAVAILGRVRDAMKELADKIRGGAETIIRNWDDIKSTAEKTALVLSPIFAALIAHWAAVATAATVSSIKQAAAWVVTKVQAGIAAIAHGVAVTVMVAGWVLMGTQALINGAKIAAGWLLALGPIGLGILALTAIAAAFVVAWKKSESFRDVVKGAFGVALTAVSGFLFGIQKMLEALGKIPGFGWADTAAKKVAGARASVDGLRDSIAGIQDKVVTITTVHRTVTEAQKDGKGGGVQKFAKGGVAMPGLAWVGEEGPELVQMRGGERIYNANDSRKMAAGGATYNLNLYGDHSISTDDVPSMFRRMELLAGS